MLPESQWVQAGIAFGANLQQPEDQVRHAMQAVASLPQTVMLKASSLYRTKPWGVENQSPFINACAVVKTGLSAMALLEACLGIEHEMGRDRTADLRWGPRLIDIDILFHGNHVAHEPALTLPHPRMMQRAFVLVPLAEIAPQMVMGGISLIEALSACDSRDVERLNDID